MFSESLLRFVVFCSYGRLIYSGFPEAIAILGAVRGFSAVAEFLTSYSCVTVLYSGFVLTVDVLFDVWHTTVTDFNCVSSKYLMYWNVLWEFFIKYFEDTSFNVRGYIFAMGGGGVVPKNSPLFCRACRLCCYRCRLGWKVESVFISGVIKGFLIDRYGFDEWSSWYEIPERRLLKDCEMLSVLRGGWLDLLWR